MLTFNDHGLEAHSEDTCLSHGHHRDCGGGLNKTLIRPRVPRVSSPAHSATDRLTQTNLVRQRDFVSETDPSNTGAVRLGNRDR